MTGTLSGYLVYRLQSELKTRGIQVLYQDMIDALTNSLLELDRDMIVGNSIELPTGNRLIKEGY